MAIAAIADRVTASLEMRVFTVRPYQPLALVSAFTLDPPRGPRALRHENRPDWLGRSVALLAPLHPKCPFQVMHQRVRALDCFLVPRYWEDGRDYRDAKLHRSIRHST